MVLQEKIITTITSIIINVISNDVGVSKTKIMERLRFKRFCRKMHKWVREYVQKNDGTILTTSAFMNYYTYQKPVERILNYLYEPSCKGAFEGEKYSLTSTPHRQLSLTNKSD